MAHPLIMPMKMCHAQWCALCLQPVEDRLTLVHRIDCLTGQLLYYYFRAMASPQAFEQAVVVNLSSVISGELQSVVELNWETV